MLLAAIKCMNSPFLANRFLLYICSCLIMFSSNSCHYGGIKSQVHQAVFFFPPQGMAFSGHHIKNHVFCDIFERLSLYSPQFLSTLSFTEQRTAVLL